MQRTNLLLERPSITPTTLVEEIRSSRQLTAPVTDEEIANIKEKFKSMNDLKD